MPTWPEELPQALERSRFSDALPEPVVRTNPRLSGDPFVRETARRSNQAPIVGVILVTSREWTVFLNFYEVALKDGSLAFDFPDPDDNETSIPVAFTRRPVLTTLSGDFHSVQLTLERQD